MPHFDNMPRFDNIFSLQKSMEREPPIKEYRQTNLEMEIALLRDEIAALRQDILGGNISTILTGRAVIDEYNRLHGLKA